jgi:hypothetical protein
VGCLSLSARIIATLRSATLIPADLVLMKGVTFKEFVSCQYYLRSWFYRQQRRENFNPVALNVTHI